MLSCGIIFEVKNCNYLYWRTIIKHKPNFRDENFISNLFFPFYLITSKITIGNIAAYTVP